MQVYSGPLDFYTQLFTETSTGPVFEVVVRHHQNHQVLFKSSVALTWQEDREYRKSELRYKIAEHVLDRIVDLQPYADRRPDGSWKISRRGFYGGYMLEILARSMLE